MALSDRTEEAAIDDQAVRLFDATGEATRTAITLDELCRRELLEPAIVKVDVHGSEGKVLMGMRETLARSVQYLLLELHPKEVVREYSGQIGWDDILGLLWSLGFHVFHVAGHRYRARDDLRRSLEDGFAYRRVEERTAELLLFDRPLDVFLLCTRDPAIERVLWPSIVDPGLAPHDW